MSQTMKRLVLLMSVLVLGLPGTVLQAQHESVNHVTQHLIDGVGVGGGPSLNLGSYFRTFAPQENCSSWLLGESPLA